MIVLVLQLLFISVAATSTSIPSPITLASILRQAFSFHQNNNHLSASTEYDNALLSGTGDLRSNLPPSISPVLLSAGRCHLALAKREDSTSTTLPTDHHLQRALVYFEAAQTLDPLSDDRNVVTAALIYIHTSLYHFKAAEELHMQAVQERHNHPEALYDYAVWLLKHKHFSDSSSIDSNSSQSEVDQADELLSRAVQELNKRNVGAHEYHRRLTKPYYIWGLVLHEMGKRFTQKNMTDRAKEMYENYGSKLWKDSKRRFLAPLGHASFTSHPGLISSSNSELFQAEEVRSLESNYLKIRQEILSGNSDKEAYTRETENLHDSGDWKQLRFTTGGGRLNKTQCARYPFTCNLVKSMKSMKRCVASQCDEIFVYVSKLVPGTNIPPHCGSTWKRIRMHLPLLVPKVPNGGKCCALKVDDTNVYWEEGKVIVFDDSFEHEVVWMDGESERLVLVVDVHHPRWLSIVNNAVTEYT